MCRVRVRVRLKEFLQNHLLHFPDAFHYFLMLFICVTETAENIGYSCNLLREEMTEVFIVSGNSPDDVRAELRSGPGHRKMRFQAVFLTDSS